MANHLPGDTASELFSNLSTQVVLLHQAIADRLGVNLTDHKCLAILQREGPMTAGELSRRTGLTTGAITGVLDRLESARFVRRGQDPADRRKTVVELSPERLDELTRIFASLAQSTGAVLDRYSKAEQTTILDFTRRTGELVEAFVQRLASER